MGIPQLSHLALTVIASSLVRHRWPNSSRLETLQYGRLPDRCPPPALNDPNWRAIVGLAAAD
jgi:hypothetical protein